MSGGRATRGSQREDLPTALALTLRARIEDGRYPTGSRLPSEPELALELGVSRPTLREALVMLAREGWLIRRHGAGTFVADRHRLINSLDTNFGVTELITQAGQKPGTDGLAHRIDVASHEARRALALHTDQSVEVLERVRTADGVPVVHSVDHIAVGLLPEGAMAKPHASLYELLESAGHAVVHGEAKLRAVTATAAIAQALGLKRGEPLMRLDQVDFDAENRPVVYSVEHHVPDAFEVTVRRRGPGTS
jgi:GntR family transcriptional regulator